MPGRLPAFSRWSHAGHWAGLSDFVINCLFSCVYVCLCLLLCKCSHHASTDLGMSSPGSSNPSSAPATGRRMTQCGIKGSSLKARESTLKALKPNSCRCKLLAASLLLWLLPAAANPPGPVDLLEAFRLGQNPAVEVENFRNTKREAKCSAFRPPADFARPGRARPSLTWPTLSRTKL